MLKRITAKAFSIFFGFPTVSALLIIGYHQLFPLIIENQHPCRSIAYAVFTQDRKKVGYILGALHAGLREEEVAIWEEHVLKFLPSIKKIYLDVPESLLLNAGLEKRLIEAVSREEILYKHKIDIDYLDSFRGQVTLMNCVQVFGPFIYRLPFSLSFCYNNPSITNAICRWFTLAHLPVNFIHNLIDTNTTESEWRSAIESMGLLRKLFLQGQMQLTPKMTDQASLYKIAERSAQMFKKFIIKQGPLSESNQFIICLGVFHISHKQGILSHFEEAGLILEPLNITFHK